MNPEKIKKYNILNLKYQIVVSDTNIHNLESFLYINNDIQFTIVGANKILNCDGTNNSFLSNKNKIYIYKNFKSHIYNEDINLLFQKCNNNEENLGFDKIKK